MNLTELPSTFLNGLLSYLSMKETVQLALTHRIFHQGIQTLNRERYQAGSYILKPTQNYIRQEMNRGTPHIFFQAPMSYGKTAVGLSVAFHNWTLGSPREERLWLIVVPANAIDTWLKEAQNMYGSLVYQYKTLDSPILVPGKSTVHRGVKRETLSSLTRAILIGTASRTEFWDVADEYGLILDEAHKKNPAGAKMTAERPVLMLSASPVDSLSSDFRHITIPDELLKEQVPEPRFEIITTGEIEERLLKQEDKKLDLNIYFQMTAHLLNQLPKRVVIFCPGNSLKEFQDFLEQNYQGYRTVLKFSKSTQVLTKAQNISNSVLLISHAVSEAINIVCDDVIIVRGDWVNKERANQILGRCLRTTNPNPFVTFYQIVPHGIPRLRTLFTNACLIHGEHMDSETVNVQALAASFRTIFMMDPQLKQTTSADILAVCKPYYSNEERAQTLEWWKKQKSAYSDQMKAQFLYLPFYQTS